MWCKHLCINYTPQIIEDAEKDQSEWLVPKDSNLTRGFDSLMHSNVVSFMTTNQYESAVTLPLDHVLDLVLSIDVLFRPNTSLMVTLQNRETKRTFNIYYIVADLLLSIQVSVRCWTHLRVYKSDIYLLMGMPNRMRIFTMALVLMQLHGNIWRVIFWLICKKVYRRVPVA